MFDRTSPQSVWKAFGVAWKEAHIEPTAVDDALYRMAYVASPAPAKLGGLKLQDAFDCGGDKKTPLAASIPLEVTVQSVVNTAGDESEALTTATARPLGALPSGDMPVCRSKGRLERKLEPQLKVVFVVSRVRR